MFFRDENLGNGLICALLKPLHLFQHGHNKRIFKLLIIYVLQLDDRVQCGQECEIIAVGQGDQVQQFLVLGGGLVEVEGRLNTVF